MKRKYLSIGLLSLLVLSLIVLALHQKFAKNIPPPINTTVQNETMIAPAIIDSLSDITRIPSLQPGVIKRIHVSVGQMVKKGEPLFSLDGALVENALSIHQLTLQQTKNAMLIQQKQLAHLQKQLARLRKLDKRAISRAELQDKVHETNMAKAQLLQAQDNLSLTLAHLKNAELTLNQYTTFAPKDGIILQINAHPNEYVGSGQQIIFMGDAKKIIVRVSLDERDVHRFHPSDPAYLISYEKPAFTIPLTFIQLDQYIVTQERLNSRVQEALYYFKRQDHPNLIAGQLFDVNITLRNIS